MSTLTQFFTGASPGGGSMQGQAFTTSGTFTVPSGVTSIQVMCVGGGAGSYGSGGGGGEVTVRNLVVIPGQVLTVLIGAGGAAGSGTIGPATNGGTTSVTGGATAQGGFAATDSNHIGLGGGALGGSVSLSVGPTSGGREFYGSQGGGLGNAPTQFLASPGTATDCPGLGYGGSDPTFGSEPGGGGSWGNGGSNGLSAVQNSGGGGGGYAHLGSTTPGGNGGSGYVEIYW